MKNKISNKKLIKKSAKRCREVLYSEMEEQCEPSQNIATGVNFGLLQNEIDSMLENFHEAQATDTFKKNVHNDLKMLYPIKKEPEKEIVAEMTCQPEPKMPRLHINQSGPVAKSPFVLDINSLVKKKKAHEEKKAEIYSWLANRNQPAKTKFVQPVIIEEVPAIEERPVLNIDSPEDEMAEFIPTTKEKKKKNNAYHVQFTPTPWFYRFNLPLRWQRSLATYALICLLIVSPIKAFGYYKNLITSKDKVIDYTKQAILNLKSAGVSLSANDIAKANLNFDQAENNFSLATNELNTVNDALKLLVDNLPTDQLNFSEAEYILESGATISDLGKKLTNIFTTFNSAEKQYLTEKIAILQEGLNEIIPQIQTLSNNFNRIRDKVIPEEYRPGFTAVKNNLQTVVNDLDELNSLATSLQDILGQNNFRRYLFVFQNSNEIRPTGGFMGSFALVDIDRGQIKQIQIPGEGIYALQGWTKVNTLPPDPIKLVKSRWEWQDANWFPDFPTSAQKIKWFYEKSGGPSVDGVIAVNVTLIPKLLQLVGPIEMPEYGLTLSAENFVEEVQNQVEFKYDKETNKPKQILSDLAPLLLDKIFSSSQNNIIEIAKLARQSLNEKEIQLYFNNPAIQEKFSAYDWTGEMKTTDHDYLAIINSNINGGKTDSFINQEYDLQSELSEDGEITNTLTITRTHTGEETSTFGKETNIDFLRVYVPEGSQLIKAENFSGIPEKMYESNADDLPEDAMLAEMENNNAYIDPASQTEIHNEFSKTVFGNWLILKPGESKTTTIVYKLPYKYKLAQNQSKSVWQIFKSDSERSQVYHSLYWQKQSGTQNTSYKARFELPADFSSQPLMPDSLKAKDQGLVYESQNTTDELIAWTAE